MRDAGFRGYISDRMFEGEPVVSRQRTKSLEKSVGEQGEDKRIASL